MSSMRLILWSLTVVLLIVTPSQALFAQAGNMVIEGVVVLQDGTPVSDAEVKASTLAERGGDKLVRSKKDGRFKIPFAQPGPYKFSATKGDLKLIEAHVVIKDLQKNVENDTDLGIDAAHLTQEVPIQASRTVQLKLVVGSAVASKGSGSAPAADALADAGRLVREGNHAGAEAILRKIIESDPENGAALYLLGVSTAALGRKDEAVGHLTRALEVDPTQVGVRSQLATIAYEKGEKDRAVTLLREEMDMAPTEAAPAINLGIILSEMGRKEDAVRAFEHAITVAPTESGPYMELAGLYTDLGQEAKAAEILKKGEALAKPDPKRWFNIGANYSNLGQDEKAEEAYRKALEVDPSFPDATRELGFTMLRRGNFSAAIPYFEKYLQLRPNADDASEVRAALDAARKNAK